MKSFAVAAALLLVACFPKSTPQAPTLTSAQIASAGTRSPGATPEALARGHATFAAKCNGCHGYPDVNAIPEAEWPGIINEMGHKAKLSPDEMNDTLRFVLVAGGHNP